MKEPKSKKLRVHETVKQRIINQDLKPGEPINERILSKELKTSKTPIREAIQQLEKEGFVENIPGRGNFVSRISIQDVRETFEIREILEGEAIKRAALRHNPEKLEAIRRAFESSEGSSQGSPSRRFRSGDQIHAFIFESIGNQRLMAIYRRLQDHIVRHRIHFFSDPHEGRPEESFKEHMEILEALASQDPARCERAIKTHLKNSLDYIKSII